MAQGSSSGKDFLQIVMMTFYLMAVFFAGWGGYNYWKVSGKRADRQKEETSLNNLQKLLAKQESKSTVRDWLRKEKSKERSTNLTDDVQDILQSLGSTAPTIKKSQRIKDKVLSANVVQKGLDLEFHETALTRLITLIYKLESEHPHIYFSGIDLKKKRARKGAESEDNWTSSITIGTYASE